MKTPDNENIRGLPKYILLLLNNANGSVEPFI